MDASDTNIVSRDGEAGDRRYHWKYAAVLGWNPNHPLWTPPYFDFQQNEAGCILSSVNKNAARLQTAKGQGFNAVEKADGISWSWSKACDTGRKDINADWTGYIPWIDRLNGPTTSYSAVDVVPLPGTGTLKVRGYTCVEAVFGGYYQRLKGSDYDYTGKYNDALRGMVCSFKNQKVFPQRNLQEHGIPQHERKSDAFVSAIENNLDTMLGEKNSSCIAINDALNATGKFQHPACGEFNFYDPIFNYRGDLLASARYKAPNKANRLNKFEMPAIGKGVEQRDPNLVNKVVAIGDIKAPTESNKQ